MNLFPDPEIVIEPALDRREPLIWVRRLTILPSLASDSRPIRDVEFRLGLNIIRHRRRPEASGWTDAGGLRRYGIRNLRHALDRR
jgi:hypothetical protein